MECKERYTLRDVEIHVAEHNSR